ESQPNQEDARLMRAEQPDQFAPEFHADRGTLHHDAIAIEADRAVRRVEDQPGKQVADRRLAPAVEQHRWPERCLHFSSLLGNAPSQAPGSFIKSLRRLHHFIKGLSPSLSRASVPAKKFCSFPNGLCAGKWGTSISHVVDLTDGRTHSPNLPTVP